MSIRLAILACWLLPVPLCRSADVEPVLDSMVHTANGASGATSVLEIGKNFDSGDGVALMKWDEGDAGFDGLLATALGGFAGINGDGSFTLHQMLTDWDESTSFGNTLPVAGVDYVAHPLAAAGFNEVDRSDSCDLAVIARHWRMDPASNRGLIAVPRGLTNPSYPGVFNPEIQIAARERQPGLNSDDVRITTTTGNATQLDHVLEAIDDAVIRSAAPSATSRDSAILGCGIVGSNPSYALYRFGLGNLRVSYPAAALAFDHASFLVFTTNRNDPAITYNVHLMLVDWDEATVTWNRFGAGGPQPGAHYHAVPVGDFTLGGGARSVDVDVRAEVEAWFAAPSSNFGLIIIPRAGTFTELPLVSSDRVPGALDQDDTRLSVNVIADLEVLFTDVRQGDVTGLSFLTEAGVNYALEYELPSAPGTWVDTGVVISGDGSSGTVFDPHGYSALKTYRLVVTTSQPPLGPTFSDQTATFFSSLSGQTAGFADFDLDGWVDLCDGTQVWRNMGGEFFSVFASLPGRTWGDMNNDGFPDLSSYIDAAVYRNAAGGGFSFVPLPGLPMQASRGSCWGDWNGDGLDDLYIGGYEFPGGATAQPDARYHSSGGAAMTLAWTQTGPVRKARGVTACDFDVDGDTDIYVSNYRLQPNLLWQNDNGMLNEVADVYGADGDAPELTFYDDAHTIGSAWGDFDNDGLFDIFVGNFAHGAGFGGIPERQPESEFLRNRGPANSYHFEDMGTGGVIYQEGNASPAAGDWDNDGDLDLFFTAFNGPSKLYRNDGNFTFVDVSAQEGTSGLHGDYQGAWADIDNDGDLDLVADGKLMINKGSVNHWLRVRLVGDGVTTSKMAVGGQVKIIVPGLTVVRQVEAGTGENNQNDPTLHFGLGAHSAPVDLEILWPGGAAQWVQNVPVDQTITVAGP